MSFQSTPPHGGRLGSFGSEHTSIGFNPRPRTGGDLVVRGRRNGKSMVSIHAPARGATFGVRGRCPVAAGFNPRPRTGGDTNISAVGNVNEGFNPRPRTGGDRPRADPVGGIRVSIHAPARGATGRSTQEPCPRPVSIHAPARGATSIQEISRRRRGCFNPRPRTGGDGMDAKNGLQIFIVSIHAPARGATCSPLARITV